MKELELECCWTKFGARSEVALVVSAKVEARSEGATTRSLKPPCETVRDDCRAVEVSRSMLVDSLKSLCGQVVDVNQGIVCSCMLTEDLLLYSSHPLLFAVSARFFNIKLSPQRPPTPPQPPSS